MNRRPERSHRKRTHLWIGSFVGACGDLPFDHRRRQLDAVYTDATAAEWHRQPPGPDAQLEGVPDTGELCQEVDPRGRQARGRRGGATCPDRSSRSCRRSSPRPPLPTFPRLRAPSRHVTTDLRPLPGPTACDRGHFPACARREPHWLTGSVHTTAVTVYGVCALTFMMAMYGFERRHHRFVLAFALGCLLSSAYGFLAGAWPFGVVEAIWAVLAVFRFRRPQGEAPAAPA